MMSDERRPTKCPQCLERGLRGRRRGNLFFVPPVEEGLPGSMACDHPACDYQRVCGGGGTPEEEMRARDARLQVGSWG